MKEIDELYKGLKNSQIEAPDVWSNVSQGLKHTNGLKMQNSTRGLTSSAITKAVLIVCGVAIVGVATYYIASSYKNDNTQTKTTQTQSQEKTALLSSNQTEKNLSVKKNSQTTFINNTPQTKANPKIVNIQTTEYLINDEQPNSISAPQQSCLKQNPLCCKESVVNPKTQYQQTDTKTQEEGKNSPITIAELRFPSVITPNGDGINDYFEIKNIDCYPENTLTIFDGKGKQIFKAKSYKNNFTANKIPSGTYFNKLKYRNLDKVLVKNGV